MPPEKDRAVQRGTHLNRRQGHDGERQQEDREPVEPVAADAGGLDIAGAAS
jgi:hypothetical protein